MISASSTLFRYLSRTFIVNFAAIMLSMAALFFVFDVVEMMRRAAKQTGVSMDIVLTMSGLKLADIIDISKLSGSTIKFGATVKLVDEDTEAEKSYQIVGDAEADLSKGRISISSPIARAMIGKEAGDSVEVAAPGGAKTYEILDVKFV